MPHARWLVWLLEELGHNSNGIPYPMTEIRAWATGRGFALSADTVESVHFLSKVWTASLFSFTEPETPPPYESEERKAARRAEVAQAVRSSMRRRKQNG